MSGKLIASCAKGQLGITESEPRVEEYIRAVGGDTAEGEPWGAAFVGWCLKSSGLSDLLAGSSGVDLWTAAQAKGFAIYAAELFKNSDLQVGDIYVIAEGPGSYNVGIVTDVANFPLLFWGIQGDIDQKGGEGFEQRLPLRMINLGIIPLVGATASAAQKTTP